MKTQMNSIVTGAVCGLALSVLSTSFAQAEPQIMTVWEGSEISDVHLNSGDPGMGQQAAQQFSKWHCFYFDSGHYVIAKQQGQQYQPLVVVDPKDYKWNQAEGSMSLAGQGVNQFQGGQFSGKLYQNKKGGLDGAFHYVYYPPTDKGGKGQGPEQGKGQGQGFYGQDGKGQDKGSYGQDQGQDKGQGQGFYGQDSKGQDKGQGQGQGFYGQDGKGQGQEKGKGYQGYDFTFKASMWVIWEGGDKGKGKGQDGKGQGQGQGYYGQDQGQDKGKGQDGKGQDYKGQGQGQGFYGQDSKGQDKGQDKGQGFYGQTKK